MLELSCIQSLQRKISKKIHCLNSGGCVHFAYYFSKKLRDLEIEHKIVYLDDQEISLVKSEFEPVNHVCIYIPHVGYIDGYKTLKKIPAHLKYKKFSVDTTKVNYFRLSYSWNSSYELRQNDLLEEIINEHNYGINICKSKRCSINKP